MNVQSSRSHAIFTIHLCQMRVCAQPDPVRSRGPSGGRLLRVEGEGARYLEQQVRRAESAAASCRR